MSNEHRKTANIMAEAFVDEFGKLGAMLDMEIKPTKPTLGVGNANKPQNYAKPSTVPPPTSNIGESAKQAPAPAVRS